MMFYDATMQIAHDDLPSFFLSGCVVDVTRWEADGTSFERWRAGHDESNDLPGQWRDEVVVPYFQRRFDALKVDENGHLYGVRGNTEGEIDERFYDPGLLKECMGAKCPGQRWHFALGCCFRQHRS
ncbi:MAG: hypothetical protein ACXV5T_07275 [Halobacteriota archaeon]